MPACSISTTTTQTTATTTSGSADPRTSCLDAGNAGGRLFLGRASRGASAPKARQYAQPGTSAGPSGAAEERGTEFHRLTSLNNLFGCWRKARLAKGHSIRVQRFGADVLHYLSLIQERLRDRSYTFGPYRCFTVREKKFRQVVDAPMKDRVVHWMIYQHLLPTWQPRFIADTYGNLPGRGTHAAVRRLSEFCRRAANTWALQLDISKYFHAVPHDLLKARLLRYQGDEDFRRLISSLIDSYHTDCTYDDLFPVDGLYRKTLAKGMPIGNLTSQLAANVFLNGFDHWIKEQLRVRCYIRYVDDVVILGNDPDGLRETCRQVVGKMAGDGLTIHPKKIRVAPVAAGVPFLGYVVWPGHISAGQYLRRRYHNRLREHEWGARDHTEALQSYRAALRHTGATR